jgi:type I restriction enzyme S subunit
MRLGEVAAYVGGITFKPTDLVEVGAPDSVVCMRTKNVQERLETEDLIAVPRSFVKRPEQMLREGDILVSSANSWNLVGKCCFVPRLPYDAAIGGFISLLRPAPERVDPAYLYRWLAWDTTQQQVRQLARQTTNIANLPRERFLDLDVPLPTLTEQRRIAAILDEADVLRRKRRESLALLDDLLRATFLDMFGDPVTNPRGWRIVRLGATFGAPPRIGTTTPAHDGGELLVVRVGDIGGPHVDLGHCGSVTLTPEDRVRFAFQVSLGTSFSRGRSAANTSSARHP